MQPRLGLHRHVAVVATLSIQQRNTHVSCHSSGRPKTSEVEEARRGAAHGSSASPARRPGYRLTQGLKLRIKNSVALKRMERMTKYAIFDLNAAWYLLKNNKYYYNSNNTFKDLFWSTRRAVMVHVDYGFLAHKHLFYTSLFHLDVFYECIFLS